MNKVYPSIFILAILFLTSLSLLFALNWIRYKHKMLNNKYTRSLTEYENYYETYSMLKLEYEYFTNPILIIKYARENLNLEFPQNLKYKPILINPPAKFKSINK